MRETFRERFWERVNKNGPKHHILKTRCWVWVRGLYQSKNGEAQYGQCYVSKNDGGKGCGQPAHRVAWHLEHGDPGDAQVLHRCDNPPCCRPSHLFLGTNQENVDDKVAKQRHARGETDGNSRFTAEQVVEMRELHAKGWSLGKLGVKYNSARAVISRIVQGISWKHAGGPVRLPHTTAPRYTKLPEATRSSIVARYDVGDATMQELADEYGVSLAGIHLIIKNGG